MKIILDTSSTNPEYNGDCDYAVVDLTPALLKQIRQRVRLARHAGQQDRDLYELYFWNSTADYYDSSLIEACQEAIAQAAQQVKTIPRRLGDHQRAFHAVERASRGDRQDRPGLRHGP